MSRCQSSLCRLNGCMFPQACPDDRDEKPAPAPAPLASSSPEGSEQRLAEIERRNTDFFPTGRDEVAWLLSQVRALSAQVRSLRDDLDQSLSDRCREETEAFMVEQEHDALHAEVRSLREENAKLRGAREILSDAQQQLAKIVDAIVAERTQRAGEHK